MIFFFRFAFICLQCHFILETGPLICQGNQRTGNILNKKSILQLKQENASHTYPINLCYSQVVTTAIFIGQQTKKTFKIFFNVNCKIEHVIQVVICILCKAQYLEEATTTFNLILNNHIKDPNKIDSILLCKYFQQWGLGFHAKSIYKLGNLSDSKKGSEKYKWEKIFSGFRN